MFFMSIIDCLAPPLPFLRLFNYWGILTHEFEIIAENFGKVLERS